MSTSVTRCAVTGASGFIGRQLCRRLLSTGTEVHALSRTEPGEKCFSAWHRCDVSDSREVSAAMHACRPQVVYHLAAIVSGSRAMELVIPTLMTNLVGTVNVLLTAAELKCSRVVCLGSLQEPDEESRVAPSSPYAAAKFSATAYARMFTEVFSLSVGIGRPFMAYGPGQMDLTKLVPLRDFASASWRCCRAFEWATGIRLGLRR